MERIKDDYLKSIQTILSLTGKRVLEVGCGSGMRTVQIAEHCSEIFSMDPDRNAITQAKNNRPGSNIHYSIGTADQLNFSEAFFDVVIFTLSFHHVPVDKMNTAIGEAVKVCKANGYIIFLEPSFEGSFFQSEIRFDGCDGDERKEKAIAYTRMLSHPELKEIAELFDETVFKFHSVEDFFENMRPKTGDVQEVQSFLQEHNFILNARRRINIFQPVKEGVL